jgi:hypothetical protein
LKTMVVTARIAIVRKPPIILNNLLKVS